MKEKLSKRKALRYFAIGFMLQFVISAPALYTQHLRLSNIISLPDPCVDAGLGQIQEATYSNDSESDLLVLFGLRPQKEELIISCLCDQNHQNQFKKRYNNVGTVRIINPQNSALIAELNIAKSRKFENLSPNPTCP